MAISEVASLVGGAALGAPFSEILKLLIAEAKKVKDFKPLSQDLASTMERLVPLCREIDLLQKKLSSGKDEFKFLIKTMKRAEEMVLKCSRVQWYSVAKKASYTREIKEIKQAFLNFCQIELQFIQHKNQLQFMTTMTTKIDLLSDRGKECREICLVPQPEDGVVNVVVSGPSACGAYQFEKELDARLCIQQLLRREDDFFLVVCLCRFLVTSQFELPRLGPTYHLEPLIAEDVKNLVTDSVPQPNRLPCAKRDNLLIKMLLKCCSGLPFAMDLSRSRRKCDGCSSAIEDKRYVYVLDAFWHPECFCCLYCHKRIAISEFSRSRGKLHQSCYEKNHHPNSYVHKEKILLSAEVSTYNEHPFWEEKNCPSNDVERTSKCCSCERLKLMETNYIMLGDGRWLCLECLKSTIMDTYESRCLQFEIRGFFGALNIKIEREFPLLFAEQQVLNKAKEGQLMIRGSPLSEEQIISSVSRRPKMGPNGVFIDMRRFRSHVNKDTTVLSVYGLPRLLTGSISALEMMHAWLRLNGYNDLKTKLEDELCQVIAHMWLESQTNVLTDAAAASSHMLLTKATNQPRQFDFEKKLVELYMIQIQDYSPYGDGFRKVDEMVSNSALKSIQSLESYSYHVVRRSKAHQGITKFPFRCLVCFSLIIACVLLVKSL